MTKQEKLKQAIKNKDIEDLYKSVNSKTKILIVH